MPNSVTGFVISGKTLCLWSSGHERLLNSKYILGHLQKINNCEFPSIIDFYMERNI